MGLDFPVDWDKKEATEDDYEIPDEIQTDIVLGDLFQIGEHRLLCGNATNIRDYQKLTGGAIQVDMVLTDPPYNVDYTGKTKDSLKILNDKMSSVQFLQFLTDAFTSIVIICKKGAAWYIWHAESEGMNFRNAMTNAGITIRQCLIWVKNSMTMGRQDYQWRHEPCLYGWIEGAAHTWYGDRKQTTILNFDRPLRNAEHPTMKPVEMIACQIKNSSKQDDVVIDPFIGSGTTMVASHQLGRKCYGMELDPKYCQVVIDRMKKLDPNIEIKKL